MLINAENSNDYFCNEPGFKKENNLEFKNFIRRQIGTIGRIFLKRKHYKS